MSSRHDLLTEFDGSVCPACHCRAHDPGSCSTCPHCELHTDEAAAFVLRYEPELLDTAALQAALDAAYADRNLVVQAFAQAMEALMWPVGWGVDPSEPDWPVLYIETPEGQVSWHIPKAERVFEPRWSSEAVAPKWDGHTNAEKAARLRAIQK